MTSIKGKCRECGQVIQASAFNKCMYCGHPLPQDQQVSDQELAAVRHRQQQAIEQEKQQHQQRMKKLGKQSSGAGDVGGFGDWGGSDGGCGDGGC